MIRSNFAAAAVAALIAGSALAGCSSNAGFGGTPPAPVGPQGGATNPPGVVGTPGPNDSPLPTPTPSTPLVVDSSTARLAYDASATDPVKAPRLVELTFALNNPGASPMPVSNLSVATDTNPAVSVPLALQALPNQDTQETLVAVASPKDPSKAKQLSLTFGDGKNTMLAQSTVDFPTPADSTLTPLDAKQAAGGVSVDDVSVTSVIAPGSGLHYDVTFSLTNAGKSKVSIAYFTVTPPKSDSVKIVVPIELPARTGAAPLSIVVPYVGKAKTLPDGKYTVSASDGTSSVATGSGPLL
jgi:hypothetical protein